MTPVSDPSDRRARRRPPSTEAHPTRSQAADRSASVPLRARRQSARLARRPRADDGRVRVGASRRQSCLRGEAQGQTNCIFVLAHELLHLALRTHDRARGSQHLEFNYAHDYIINDILRAELGVEHVPAGGLDMPGASKRSAEEIVLEMRRNAAIMPSKTAVFGGRRDDRSAACSGAGRATGRGRSWRRGTRPATCSARSARRRCSPTTSRRRREDADAIKEAASAGLALARAVGALKGLRGDDPGATSQVVTALRGLYRTPWEVVLQRWMESVAPGERTFVTAVAPRRRSIRPRPARTTPRRLDVERDRRHQRIDGRRDPARARRHRRFLRCGRRRSDPPAAVRRDA